MDVPNQYIYLRLQDLETSKELKDMGFNFSGYIGDGNILIE